MVFGVTNSSRLAQYLVVSRRVVSPTLLNVVIVVPCKCLGGITALQCCDHCHFSSRVQSLMTMFHHKLLTREGRDLANGHEIVYQP